MSKTDNLANVPRARARSRIEDTGCEERTAAVHVLEQQTVDAQDSRVPVPLVARDHDGHGGRSHRPESKVGDIFPSSLLLSKIRVLRRSREISVKTVSRRGFFFFFFPYMFRWCKTYNLIHAHLSATSYFTTQQWHFKNNATVKLWERMCAVDREIFEFDMSNFDWVEYVKRMARGIRTFVVGKTTTWDAVVKEGLAEYVEL